MDVRMTGHTLPPERFGRLVLEVKVYVSHVVALLWPGVSVAPFGISGGSADLDRDWADPDLTLLIEEGRRQLDRQRRDLDSIQHRAQTLFTVSIASMAAALGVRGEVSARGEWWVGLLWLVGVVSVGLAALGAGAVTAVRSEFRGIHVANLTESTEVLYDVAAAYVRSVGSGENTVATRLTIFRDAASLLVYGISMVVSAWMFST